MRRWCLQILSETLAEHLRSTSGEVKQVGAKFKTLADMIYHRRFEDDFASDSGGDGEQRKCWVACNTKLVQSTVSLCRGRAVKIKKSTQNEQNKAAWVKLPSAGTARSESAECWHLVKMMQELLSSIL